ncbi:peroxiredoxin-like family protein [uncultured Clostridium sp.]|jgi:peroxiredoxin|uniref:peroxiredoxin-like family protein n=1 Tax=uncultured Clostridium sp. TaxID=59620 RepID=UPI0026230CC3|nr:peroxiredoxin-like family protein [uncultured Clostridium sp.]
MNLSEKLEELGKKSSEKMPKEIQNLFMDATKNLKATSIEENALKVGDIAPKFILKNAYGKEFTSEAVLKNGPLVINFYRGKWCPYCNLELQEYSGAIEKIKELGATFIAISPELPDETFSDKIPFDILSDKGSKVAKDFKIVFEVSEKVEGIYKSFGIDIEKSNGDDSHELPMPATYIIDKDGKIVLSFVNADYTKRLDVETVLDKLKELK